MCDCLKTLLALSAITMQLPIKLKDKNDKIHLHFQDMNCIFYSTIIFIQPQKFIRVEWNTNLFGNIKYYVEQSNVFSILNVHTISVK